MNAALLIDFGSTYTKLRAIDLDQGLILATSQGPSTIDSDITIGMDIALENLRGYFGQIPNFRYRLASSSAAGGLKMVTIGLVRELTMEAAKRAALGAGAKLIGTYAYRVNLTDIQNIINAKPDIILLAGGTDGGDSQVVIHNSRLLGESSLDCPIIYAGNRSAVDEVALNLSNKHLVISENVMPEFGELNIEPTRAVIRDLFIKNIINAKGINKAKDRFDSVLMPTPAAVLEGARILADGIDGSPGLGELIVIDPGGATTDVHSVSDGVPTKEGIVSRGLKEMRLKRTVEGDLGMRHNAKTIVEITGIKEIAEEAHLDEVTASKIIDLFSKDVDRLPASKDEIYIDEALAKSALKVAMRRHCGSTEIVYTANGPVTALDGKDLTGIKTIIGTGGVIAHSQHAEELLRSCLYDPSEPSSMRPISPKIMIDRNYILFAAGLLSQVDPKAALKMAINSLN